MRSGEGSIPSGFAGPILVIESVRDRRLRGPGGREPGRESGREGGRDGGRSAAREPSKRHHEPPRVSKTTPIQGRVNLTLRAEAFNLFNRAQFGPPNTTVTTAATSTLGKVTTQVNQPRLMQLAARLTF